MGASEVCTSPPSRVKGETWQDTHRRNPPCLLPLLGSDVARLRYLKIPLAAIDRHQISHQLTRHRQRRAIGVAFPLFLVVGNGQLRAYRGAIFAASISVVCKCLLRCLDSGVRCTVFPELLSAPHNPQ